MTILDYSYYPYNTQYSFRNQGWKEREIIEEIMRLMKDKKIMGVHIGYVRIEEYQWWMGILEPGLWSFA